MNSDQSRPRLLLGIDSATSYLALSLVEAPPSGMAASTGVYAGSEVARYVEDLGREHARQMMGQLEALLKGAGADRKDIVGVGVGVGPGSYTGVRVGVATAVALGRAWSVPVGGSSSLLALLSPDLPSGQIGVAVLDARRDNVYALAARNIGAPLPFLEPLGEPVKLPRAQLAAQFHDLPLFEGAPDASVIARRALAGGATGAYYL